MLLSQAANSFSWRTQHGSVAMETAQNDSTSLKEEDGWRRVWGGRGGPRVKQHTADVCRLNAWKKVSWSESQQMVQLIQQSSQLVGCCHLPPPRLKTWAWSLTENTTPLMSLHKSVTHFLSLGSVFSNSISTASYDYSFPLSIITWKKVYSWV